MVKKQSIWSKTSNTVKNSPKWERKKSSTTVKNGLNGQKRSTTVKNAQKRSKMVKNYQKSSKKLKCTFHHPSSIIHHPSSMIHDPSSIIYHPSFDWLTIPRARLHEPYIPNLKLCGQTSTSYRVCFGLHSYRGPLPPSGMA